MSPLMNGQDQDGQDPAAIEPNVSTKYFVDTKKSNFIHSNFVT